MLIGYARVSNSEQQSFLFDFAALLSRAGDSDFRTFVKLRPNNRLDLGIVLLPAFLTRRFRMPSACLRHCIHVLLLVRRSHRSLRYHHGYSPLDGGKTRDLLDRHLTSFMRGSVQLLAVAIHPPGEFSKRDSPGAESMKDAVSIRALQREDILVTTDLTARSIAEHG
jgi:hypothetical protein